MSYIFNLENYPDDYHLGISLLFWIIFIIEAIIIALIRFYQAWKEGLINRKEMLLGTGFAALGAGIFFLLVQIGVYYPSFFAIYLLIGLSVIQLGMVFLVYYWENNLINLKKIPTISSIAIFILFFINMFTTSVFNQPIFEFLDYTYIFLFLVQFSFIYILALIFAIRVVGKLRILAISFLFGFLLIFIGGLLDHPPLVFLLPEYMTILTPILFIIGFGILYYAINGICDGLSTFYNREQMCIVHRGVISKGTAIYYCPSCNTTYCQRCYEEVVKNDGCWNCGQGIMPKQEKEWESNEVLVIDPKKDFKTLSPK